MGDKDKRRKQTAFDDSDKPKNSLRRFFVSGMIAIGATLVTLLLSVTWPVRYSENFIDDIRLSVATKPNTAPIVFIKVDEAAVQQQAEQSECHCLSPIDKVWLGKVIKTASAKGAKVIGVDYLMDYFRTQQELDLFAADIASIKTPVVAVVDETLAPGQDFPVVPALHYSNAKMPIESDGIVRYYAPIAGDLRSLSAEMIVVAGGGLVPPDQDFEIRYRQANRGAMAENIGAFAPSFSGAQIDLVPDAFMKDKYVLIGRNARATGTGQLPLFEDMLDTPLRFTPGHYDGTPGVEVHGHALSQMLMQDRVTRFAAPLAVLMVVVFAIAGVVMGRTVRRWWVALIAIVVLLAVMIVGSVAVIGYFDTVIPIVAPLFALLLAFVLANVLTADRLRGEVGLASTTLKQYLAPQVADRILALRSAASLSTIQRDITVIVTDLENSSQLVANMKKEAFGGLINDYFSGMLEILWKFEGTVDKFTGDGVIAFFGAPENQPDHADKAIACARELDAFAERFRRIAAAKYHVQLGRTRMGLHSGRALVGNFGGRRRFNYTAYGEVVVIAARLEAANKNFDTRVLYSDGLRERLKTKSPDRSLGAVELKGVDEKVNVFTLVQSAAEPAIA